MTDRKKNGNKANNGSKWIVPRKRHAIYVRDDLSCVYCGLEMDAGVEFTLDHLVPTELGGSNETRNLITCCKSCNSMKGSKSMRDFFRYLSAKGVDVKGISKRIVRNTRRVLKGYNSKL